MTREVGNYSSPPAWLVDWMRDASCHGQRHSLALGSTTNADLESVARAVADYLNEFDSNGGCQWRTFDTTLLRQLAGNPASRDLVLAGAVPRADSIQPRPDLDRVIRRLARLGGVILVGSMSLEATADLSETFHVFLSSDEPADRQQFHIWVNPHRFSLPSLVSVIADSFLNWSHQREALAQRPPEITPALRDHGSGPDLPY